MIPLAKYGHERRREVEAFTAQDQSEVKRSKRYRDNEERDKELEFWRS
ncbi:hypothetical protein MCM1_2768 [Methanosarcina barkeri CM1]|uniref:Uncharacterized protein n=1 Tax=Methanosarcina barkeri CM1 TaxID=796385 RepID=A0A0G3CKX1_METBA|nr:hypothetical protein MCM1_2768 [Methanosarcina barkeri CM1]